MLSQLTLLVSAASLVAAGPAFRQRRQVTGVVMASGSVSGAPGQVATSTMAGPQGTGLCVPSTVTIYGAAATATGAVVTATMSNGVSSYYASGSHDDSNVETVSIGSIEPSSWVSGSAAPVATTDGGPQHSGSAAGATGGAGPSSYGGSNGGASSVYLNDDDEGVSTVYASAGASSYYASGPAPLATVIASSYARDDSDCPTVTVYIDRPQPTAIGSTGGVSGPSVTVDGTSSATGGAGPSAVAAAQAEKAQKIAQLASGASTNVISAGALFAVVGGALAMA